MNTDKEVENFIEKSFLDLVKIDDYLFWSRSLWKDKHARGAFGGQVIGHSLVAASKCIPHECHLHSMHAYFLRPGNTDRQILYQVDVTRAGRTYFSTAVKAIQANRAIFTMQASFKREEENPSSYQLSMPKVPFPDELSSPEENLNKLREQEMISSERYKRQKEKMGTLPILVKYVQEEQVEFSTTQKQTVWIKVKGHLPDDLHPNIHKCCLAYMSDAYLLSTAAKSVRWLQGDGVFVASLDHSMWFHATTRADEWNLFDVEIDSIGDGRALMIGRIWRQDGTLVTTIAQEGVCRLPVEKKSKL